MERTHQYDDILHLPHHVSETRPRMPLIDRAAQFSAFAALTGYDGVVSEAARVTDEKIELDEVEIERLGLRWRLLLDRAPEHPTVTVTFFRQDETKSGGAYLTKTAPVKRLDEIARTVIFEDGETIPASDVVDLRGEIFTVLESEEDGL